MITPGADPDWEAIARYLAGESDAAESAGVRAWLEANPGEASLVRILNTAPPAGAAVSGAEISAADVSAADVNAALDRVRQRIRGEASDDPGPPIARPAHRRRHVATAIATLAAAAAILLVVTLRRGNDFSAAPPAPRASRTYATTVGQRDSLLLPDGSRVILGPLTTLTIVAEYGDSTRVVALNGDAYFDVRHDPRRPFAVVTGNARIEDVGTTFDVESGPGLPTVVAVTAGSVRLHFAPVVDDVPSVVLAAGDRGTIDAAGRTTVERQAVDSEEIAWTTGRLVFRDTPLPRVASALARWYGVRIIVADSALRARHVTASFSGESIDQVLHILGLTLGVTIEHRGDSAVVLPPRGSAAKP
jgi:transmembrane sensor